MSTSKQLSEPMNLQIIRTRHPPAIYLEQVALLHTQENQPATATDIRRRMDNLPRSDRLLLAVEGETLLGYAHLRTSSDLLEEKSAEIVTLLVRATHRNKNIGRRIINASETWSRELGCVRLLCRIGPSNASAVDFFNTLGFSTNATLLELARDIEG